MGNLLGYLNLFLMLVNFSIYPIRKIYMKTHNPSLLEINRFLRKIHPIIGITIIIIALIHAYLNTGMKFFSNGYFVLCIIILMALVSVLGKNFGFLRSKWMTIHRWLVVPLSLAIIVHVLL